MRILTNSPFESKGLISISEADENGPQRIVFCIPIEIHEAEGMRDISDFENYFRDGISTKIKEGDTTKTIYLDYISPRRQRERSPIPKFVASVTGYTIDFYLSPLNFVSGDNHRLNINFFYNGRNLAEDLYNKRLIIVEPDWRQLDKLFLSENIVFTDWK